MFMTSFWDHLYQYAQEHLVVRYLQEEPTGYGRLSIQTDARRRGLEDLLGEENEVLKHPRPAD